MSAKIDSIVKRAYEYLDVFYSSVGNDEKTKKLPRIKNIQEEEEEEPVIPIEKLVIPDTLTPIHSKMPSKTAPIKAAPSKEPITAEPIKPFSTRTAPHPAPVLKAEPSKRFVYLKNKSGREIIEIIQKECGVLIPISPKSKERIVKKAKEILKEHGLRVVL